MLKKRAKKSITKSRGIKTFIPFFCPIFDGYTHDEIQSPGLLNCDVNRMCESYMSFPSPCAACFCPYLVIRVCAHRINPDLLFFGGRSSPGIPLATAQPPWFEFCSSALANVVLKNSEVRARSPPSPRPSHLSDCGPAFASV